MNGNLADCRSEDFLWSNSIPERNDLQSMSPASPGIGQVVPVPEIRFLFADPFDEFFHFGMVPQALEGVVKIQQFTFGENGVDFGMTNDMERHGFRALVGFGFEVMLVDGTAFDEIASTNAASADDFGC